MKTTIWTKSYFISLAERVVATFLAVMLTWIIGDGLNVTEHGVDPTVIHWVSALKFAAGAALVSLVKGILANLATKDGPSVLHTEKVTPPLPAPAES